MANQRQLLLGAFLVIVLSILGVYTLFLTDFSLFSARHEIVVQFPEANGLRKGDSVLVAGIRQGRVKLLAFDGAAPVERRVTATLVLDQALALREGFDVYIADATVLGGKQVCIDPGQAAGAPVAVVGPVQGHVKAGALDGLGQLVERYGSRLEKLLDDTTVVVADLKDGKGPMGVLLRDEKLGRELAEGIASAKTSFANIEVFTNDLREGKGILGRLAKDEDLAKKFEEIAANLQQISTEFKVFSGDVQAGKGVIGRLVKDEQLGEDVAQAAATIRDISKRINAAEGSLWKLVEDPAFADNLRDFSAKMESGTLGKLFTNDELYAKLSKIADDLSSSTTALRNAEGTLGKLVMDKELYEEVRRALGILTRTLEEYREAAPITTFSSILFSGF